MINKLEEKINNKKLIVGVIGLGYVGLPLSALVASKGYKVYGFDINKERINKLLDKQNYIPDVNDNLLKEIIDNKMFIPTNDFELLNEVDFIIICVPTPLNKKRKPDLSCLYNAVKDVSKHLKDDIVVVIESTTYPGTTNDYIRKTFSKKGYEVGENLYLAFSPERIDPSNKKYNVINTNRVVGGCDDESTEIVTCFYKSILDSKVISVSNSTVAEMSKILENTYRLVNIALIFEFVKACNKLDINIWEVIDAAKSKQYGFQAFYPSAGVGGHCIPIDPIYLTWDMKKKHVDLPLINVSDKIVNSVPKTIVKRIKNILKEENIRLKDANILLVGMTYKKDTNDLRESPGLKILDILNCKKSTVDYYDNNVEEFTYDNIKYRSIDLDNINQYDLVVICVDHSNIDYDYISENSRTILDLKNIYSNDGDVYGL